MCSELCENIMPGNMTDETFLRFSSFVHRELGIKLTAAKKTMLQARLTKRLRKLKIDSFDEYYDYVFSKEGVVNEMPNMIDVVTTNKTDFFREPYHFDFLVNSALPSLKILYGAGVKRKLLIWSAGCASGEEPYSLAMVLSEFAHKFPGYQFSILATDISNKVLMAAMLGIYSEKDIGPLPMDIRKKYLLRSKDITKRRVRIVPDLRSKIDFRRVNFMDNDYGLHNKRDVIFCRNVIIYFSRETQEKVLNKLCHNLNPGGYLFMGHSETLTGMNLPISQVGSTVYRKHFNQHAKAYPVAD